MIRCARVAELPVLQDIERAAGETFRAIGMPEVADDEPFSIDELLVYLRDGRVWVALLDNRPVGYVLVDIVDGLAHIEQVSVHPRHAHRGIGRELIEHCARWAGEQGYPAMTLTTFTEVGWNGPYYRRLGFRELLDGEFTPGLQELRMHEAAAGLDRWPRECLRLDLPRP
jgi:ribosomal protein S18 acetylase RimI-like enzyme